MLQSMFMYIAVGIKVFESGEAKSKHQRAYKPDDASWCCAHKRCTICSMVWSVDASSVESDVYVSFCAESLVWSHPPATVWLSRVGMGGLRLRT